MRGCYTCTVHALGPFTPRALSRTLAISLSLLAAPCGHATRARCVTAESGCALHLRACRESFKSMSKTGLTSFECDKSLATDRNLELIRRKFPDHCRFHIAHNVLGGKFEQHGACTVAPFGNGICTHGSHADPASTTVAQEQRRSQVSCEKILQLPLGFSRQAGSSKLADGCGLCETLDFDVACTSCGRSWVRSRRKGSKPVAADDAAWHTRCQQGLQQQGGDDYDEYGEEAPWFGNHEGGGEKEWWDEEDGPGEEEEDSASDSDSSSGEAAQPPAKRARVEPIAPTALGEPAAPTSGVAMLELQLEASRATVRALEAELKLVKRERDDAVKRLE